MGQDVLELVEPYLAEDPADWESLADDLRFHRVQILLLREILVELRKLNRAGPRGGAWVKPGERA
jgi:hypothetical protein